MRYARMLGLLAMATAFLALAATATAATPLTSPAGSEFAGTLHAESEGTVELHGEAFSLNCKSTLAAEMEASGSATTAVGKITNLAFSECNFPVTVLKTGSLEIHSTAGGTVTWTGGEFTVHGPFGINCIYSTNNTDIGTFTGSTTTKATATLDLQSSSIPRTAHNAFCGANAEWTGSYKVTSPDYLAIEGGALPSSPLTSPAGTNFAGTIHAESEGAIGLHTDAFSFNCKKSTFSVEFEAPSSATTIKGQVNSLAFVECGFPVTVKALGSLEVHSAGGGNGTVTWSGGEFTVDGPFGINCLYKTNNTHIGTLTGSKTTGGTATLDLGSAKIPRTGHSAACGTNAEWTGSYKVTSPDYLAVDGAAPPSTRLTSPAGSEFAGTLHAESEGAVELHGEAFSVNCKSTFGAAMKAPGSAATVTGEINSLTFSECTFPVTVLKTGSLEIHAAGGGNGTITWTGGEFTVHGAFGVNCTYSTKSTDIGTLTGSTTTKATATLDLQSSLIPRTGDSAFCGANAEWTGSYKVTSPDYLAVD